MVDEKQSGLSKHKQISGIGGADILDDSANIEESDASVDEWQERNSLADKEELAVRAVPLHLKDSIRVQVAFSILIKTWYERLNADINHFLETIECSLAQSQSSHSELHALSQKFKKILQDIQCSVKKAVEGTLQKGDTAGYRDSRSLVSLLSDKSICLTEAVRYYSEKLNKSHQSSLLNLSHSPLSAPASFDYDLRIKLEAILELWEREMEAMHKGDASLLRTQRNHIQELTASNQEKITQLALETKEIEPLEQSLLAKQAYLQQKALELEKKESDLLKWQGEIDSAATEIVQRAEDLFKRLDEVDSYEMELNNIEKTTLERANEIDSRQNIINELLERACGEKAAALIVTHDNEKQSPQPADTTPPLTPTGPEAKFPSTSDLVISSSTDKAIGIPRGLSMKRRSSNSGSNICSTLGNNAFWAPPPASSKPSKPSALPVYKR
jgi:hypothetical protein